MEVRTLKIPNLNHRLNCNAFVVIGLAPLRNLTLADLDTTYKIMVDEAEQLIILRDILMLKVRQVSNVVTIPAEGVTSSEWMVNWFEKHPEHTLDTKIAIYCYVKQKEN